MTTKEKAIEIPDILAYPRIEPLSQCNEILNNYCYIFKKYSLSGISVLIVRSSGYVVVKMADFAGRMLDPQISNQYAKVISEEYLNKLVTLMKHIRIPRAIFYFSTPDVRLVDIRLSVNKFCSPGYVNDFFGKFMPLQEQIGKPMILNPENVKILTDAIGDYKDGKFIIKTTVPKSLIRGEEILPLYAQI